METPPARFPGPCHRSLGSSPLPLTLALPCVGVPTALAVCLLLVLLLPAASARAQSTINATRNQSWAANLGWTQWRPSAADGVVLGEYVCSGNVYAANVGWISLGNGSPANGIQYGNAAAGDFGVNYLPSTTPGVGLLRGLAYGANIGWINFENLGNPAVNLLNGQLSGYAYSANCGWINLGSNTPHAVQTDAIAPGADTDGDGIADAYELRYFGNLLTVNATSDRDGDGRTDLQEYLDGTDPTDPGGALRVSAFNKAGTTLTLTFLSTPARLYLIEQSPSLTAPAWTDAGLGTFAPDLGAATTRQFSAAASASAFYRVRALRFGL
jgi:hypothetical protein